MLDFWAKTSGTWINVGTIVIGTVLGLLMSDRLPPPMQRIITQGLGLTTLFIGISMAQSLFSANAGIIDGVILGLITLVLGGLCGEWLAIETKLSHLGDWLKRQFKGEGRFTEGFVAASLLFCVGPLALVGSLNNGLLADNTLLVIKATMDGLASIALTSTYGMGVGFSALPLLAYQGGISLLASSIAQTLPDPETAPSILLITGVGGLMILAIGLNLLEISKIRVASFLPAPLIAPLLHQIIQITLPRAL